MSTIKFERIERDCPYNKDLRRDGEKRGIIYDFNVIIYGEHRAQFCRNYTGRGYYLYDADHQPIADKSTYTMHAGNRVIEIKSQAEFEATIQRLLSEEKIPTLAQMAEAKAERQREKDQRDAEEAEKRRIWRIKDAGVELYEAAKQAQIAVAELCQGQHPDNQCWVILRQIEAAIAKAEKGAEA